MRYFIEIAYDGTGYHGWQTQPNARTVQEVLTQSLETILQQPVETVGSGRTDTGVHAAQQWVHFDTKKIWQPEALAYRLNRLLPPDISVGMVHPVGPEAHTRFDAVSRTYEYRITRTRNPFLVRYAHYLGRDLNLERLHEAAAVLLEFEDFTTFSKVKGDTLHYRCKIFAAYWQVKGSELVFTIQANRFLRGMVRLIVGALLDVGTGKRSVSDLREIIARQDRRLASGAAPAPGLFLTRVDYPEEYFAQQRLLFQEHKTSGAI